jgi:hypothetical protein
VQDFKPRVRNISFSMFHCPNYSVDNQFLMGRWNIE